MNTNNWLVVMTKPRMEAEAEVQLGNQDFDVYLPRWVEMKRRANGWQRVESVMFPRYLFVRPKRPQQDLSVIRSTRGVIQMVRFGTQPAWAANALIEDIRAIEDSRFKPDADLAPFKKGQSIIVTDGPFKGVAAQVWSVVENRVVILFELMGKTQRITVESAAIQSS